MKENDRKEKKEGIELFSTIANISSMLNFHYSLGIKDWQKLVILSKRFDYFTDEKRVAEETVHHAT